MGEIVVAEDLEASPAGRKVVLKRLLEEFVEDEELLEMFRAEARITSRLVHPNIVRILDTPIIEDSMCLALEFVPGRNVLQIMRAEKARGTRVPPNVAVHVIEQALRGLHHAHTAVDEYGHPLEIVHRDVSPGNILVAFDGAVKITDFGIAKSRISVASTTADLLRGTTRFLSPEQIRGGRVSARSDLFSTATVLVELLTGEPLFDRGAVPPTLLAIVKGQRPPLAEVLPAGHPTLAGVLEASLSVSPADRPQSASDFADVLLGAQHELGGAIAPEELGHYLRGLFDEGPVDAVSQTVGAGATYLIEVGEPIAMTDGKLEWRVGSRPLDASEFEASGDSAASAGSPAPRASADRAAWPAGSTRAVAETVDMSGDLEGNSDSNAEVDAFDVGDRSPALRGRVPRWTWFFGGLAVGVLVMFAAFNSCDDVGKEAVEVSEAEGDFRRERRLSS